MTGTANQRCLGHAIFGVIVVLAGCAYGQTNDTSKDVFLVNTTQLFSNGSGEAPQVLAIQRPCGPKHEGYCLNGVCTFSPEMNTPICRCYPMYQGVRCEHITMTSTNLSRSEEVIGITCGVILLLGALVALIVYCYLWKRKSSPPYKNYGSENSV
ncbi:epigen [Paramisgurnus dabryanus]|uniref:epigen n=1 Tax=Paramisgurnus dabryanus TaxID=90735 RepID=UPI0031F37C56